MQRFISRNRCSDCTYSVDRTLSWSSSVGIFTVVAPGSVQVVYKARTVNFPRETLPKFWYRVSVLVNRPGIGMLSEQRRGPLRFPENSRTGPAIITYFNYKLTLSKPRLSI
ncbi:hypothetical protein Prudu_016606, partial [Prunus dulcis]